MSIQAGKILDVLILLMLANGAPVIGKKLLENRFSCLSTPERICIGAPE